MPMKAVSLLLTRTALIINQSITDLDRRES